MLLFCALIAIYLNVSMYLKIFTKLNITISASYVSYIHKHTKNLKINNFWLEFWWIFNWFDQGSRWIIDKYMSHILTRTCFEFLITCAMCAVCRRRVWTSFLCLAAFPKCQSHFIPFSTDRQTHEPNAFRNIRCPLHKCYTIT